MLSQQNTISYFPSQKLATKEKDFKWIKQCADALVSIALYSPDSDVRSQRITKSINYDLMNNILTKADIERTMNPWKLKVSEFPVDMRNYPLIKPKIDLLVGEELKRKFDFKVAVINKDAISLKKKEHADLIRNKYLELVGIPGMEEEQIKAELEIIKPFLSMDAQDCRERRANHYLNYLYKSLNLKINYNKGFEDFLISSEEIYATDIVAGEPVQRRANPLNITTLRSGESPYIEDADMIMEHFYAPIGWILENYHEYLTAEDIKKIESGNIMSQAGPNNYVNYLNNIVQPVTEDYTNSMGLPLISVNDNAASAFGGDYDSRGNYRVCMMQWKSFRKVGKLTRFDEATGQEVVDYVDENHKADESLGETITWLWIPEWWEATRLGSAIYVKYGPRDVQCRSKHNIAKCLPGYSGICYNINNSRAMSLVDTAKPYQYLFNTLMYRVDLAFAKSKGKIGLLNMHLIPDGWSVEKWLYYAEMMGWAPYDAFKSTNEGPAAGKLAGNMNQLPPEINLEMSGYIQQHLIMLDKIEQQVDAFTGISKQRQGQISTNELVGNVERSTIQSSHITEKWFALHEQAKLKALSNLLEHAKVAWKGKKEVLTYITDELSTAILEIDGDAFAEHDYGLFLSNSADDMKLLQLLESYIPKLIETNGAELKDIFTIFDSTSVATKRRIIEENDKRRKEAAAKAEEAKQQFEQQRLEWEKSIKERELELKQLELELLKYKIDLDSNTRIETATLQSQMGMLKIENDRDKDGIPDELEKERLRMLNEEKITKRMETYEKLKQSDEKLKTDIKFKEKELALKEKKLEIDAKKASTSSKKE